MRNVWHGEIKGPAQESFYLTPVLTLLIVEPWGVSRIGIRRRLVAEGTAVGTEGIVHAVRLEGATSSEGIGSGIRIERIRAQLAEIFRPGRNSEEKHQNQNPHHEPLRSALTSASTFQDVEPPKSGTSSGLSRLLARRSSQANNLDRVVERVCH